MKYVALFDLRIRHAFYTDGNCRDFDVEPDEATEALLRNHRLILRQGQDGVRLIGAVDQNGRPLIPIPEGATFGFHLRLRNADFPLFTDLTLLRSQPAPLYSNDGLAFSDKLELRLASRKASSSETFAAVEPGPNERFVLGGKPLQDVDISDFAVESRARIGGVTVYDDNDRIISLDSRAARSGDTVTVTYPSRPCLRQGVFADVEILFDDTLPDIRRPQAFHIAFEAKLARWSYYCVTDIAGDLADFEIADTSSARTGPRLTFSDDNRTDLNQTSDPSDEVAEALAQRYPTLQRYRFVSDDLIPCRQAARKNLELRFNGDKLVGSLPNPLVRDFARVGGQADGGPHRQDTLFHVIKLLTRLKSKPH